LAPRRPRRARPLLRRPGRLRDRARPDPGGLRRAARADPRRSRAMTLPAAARDARRVGGGDINEAWKVQLDGRTAFVKTRPDAAPGESRREAGGLRWLGEVGSLPVPRVLEVSDTYLALEWVEPGMLDAAGTEQLGRGLATIHSAGAPCFGDPGFGERLGLQAR